VRVKWTGAAPLPSATAQRAPKLYVLAVGVSNYQHAQIGKLNFAAKDARDFAAAMQAQQGRLYQKVEVRLLADDPQAAGHTQPVDDSQAARAARSFKGLQRDTSAAQPVPSPAAGAGVGRWHDYDDRRLLPRADASRIARREHTDGPASSGHPAPFSRWPTNSASPRHGVAWRPPKRALSPKTKEMVTNTLRPPE
jgi:hypothetical protein